MKTGIKFFYILFSLVVLSGGTAFAQLSKEDKLDSLKAKFVKDSARIYRHANVSFVIGGDNRNTVIRTDTKAPVKVKGGQIGLTIDNHSIGLGVYTMTNTKQVYSELDKRKIQNVNLTMSYATLFYEYQILNTRFWEVGFPVEIGGGSYITAVTDSLGKPDMTFKDTLKRGILLLGAGVNVDFKILKWFGFNAMIGYRVVGGNEPDKVNFNGLFWSTGSHFYFGEFIRAFRLHEKRGAYGHNVSMINNPITPD
jgi:hypothetical protein